MASAAQRLAGWGGATLSPACRAVWRGRAVLRTFALQAKMCMGHVCDCARATKQASAIAACAPYDNTTKDSDGHAQSHDYVRGLGAYRSGGYLHSQAMCGRVLTGPRLLRCFLFCRSCTIIHDHYYHARLLMPAYCIYVTFGIIF